MRKILLGVLVVVVALAVAGVLYLKSIDFNQFKGLIAEKAEEATGRKLTLAGDVRLNIFTLTPSLAVDDVSFANAPWGSRPEMAKLKRLEAQVALMPLLSKQVQVQRFILVAPDILLETDAAGKGNWEFAAAGAPAKPAAPAKGEKPAAGPAAQITVNEVDIKNGTLTYRDGKTKQTTTVALDDLSATSGGGESPLTFHVSGAYNKAPFEAKGTLGPLAEIQAPKKPFPVDIEAGAGGAKIKAKGTIAQPAAVKGLDLNVSVEGKTLADLAAFAPGLPGIGPYHLAGHVGDKGADTVVDHLDAVLGHSDLAGELTLVKADKPTLRATLTSKLIDLAELQAAAGGAPPEAAAAGGAKPEAKPGAQPGGDGRLFSDAPLPVAGLKAANADVKLSAAKVATAGPALNYVTVGLALNNGKLTIKPFQADVVGGRIDSDTVLDASQAQPVLSLNAKAKGLDLAELVKEMKVDQKVTGKADFDAVANGSGPSVRAIMAGLNGQTNLSIGEMRVDSALMKIVMADLAKAVTGSGDASKISCVVSRFDIVKGLATSKAMVVDAESVTIRGSGTINLATEQLDLYLDPSPKAAAVVDLAIPVKVTGTLAKPNAVPDPMAAAKKVGSALGGAAGAAGAVGGIGGGVLGKILGEKGGGAQPAPSPAPTSGNPCLEQAAAPAPAQAPAKATTQPAQPAPAPQQPSSPLEDVGKKLKGLFE